MLALVLALAFLNFLALLDECFCFRVRFRLDLLLLGDVGGSDVDGNTVTDDAGGGSGGFAGGGVDAFDCNSAVANSAVGLVLEWSLA